MENAKEQTRTLALLLGLPHQSEIAMHNDIMTIYKALRKRGLEPEQILCFEGKFDRGMLLGLIQSVARLLQERDIDELFIHVSGHGYFDALSPYERGIGIALESTDQMTPNGYVFWEELLRELDLSPSVHVTLLPDHCYTNLFARRLPANISAIVMKTEPEDSLVCQASNYDFEVEGITASFGVLSYYALSTLPHVADLGSWLQQIQSRMDVDRTAGTLKSFAIPLFQIVGNPTQLLPGLVMAR